MKRFYCNGKKGYCDRGNDANVECFNCEFGNGEGGKEVEVLDTNYDRIRNMSVEELAGFLENTNTQTAIKIGGEYGYIVRDKKYIKMWLESEVTEE